MSQLLQQIGSQLTADQLTQISKAIGADEHVTTQAVSAVLPTLVGAITQQADQPDQTQNLHRALQNDHDGSILDHLGSLFGDGDATANPGVTDRTTAGNRILEHLLGDRTQRVGDGVSRASGLSGGQAMKLMMMLAPLLMGVLGKRQREEELSPAGLGEMLRGENQAVREQTGGSMIGRLLDQDGDGDFDMMDMVKFGMSRLFGR